MKNLFGLFFIFSMLLACTEEVRVEPYTYTNIFTGERQKSWNIRNIQLLEEGKGTQTFSLDPCVLDDLYTFYATAERLYRVFGNNNKCEGDEGAILNESNWSFANASATMNIVVPLLSDDTLPFIVREASEDRMTLEIFFNDGNSSYRINFRASTSD